MPGIEAGTKAARCVADGVENLADEACTLLAAMAAITAEATADTKARSSAWVVGVVNELAALESTEDTLGEEDVETISEAIEEATNRPVERLLFIWRLELDESIVKALRTTQRDSKKSVTKLAKRLT